VEELFASLIKDFVEETGPLAREVANLLLQLEETYSQGKDDRSLRLAIKSALHTVKGNAAMMGLSPIESLAHALEDCCQLLDGHFDGQEPGQIQLLQDGTDLLIRAIQASLQGDPESAQVAQFIERAARPLTTPARAQPLGEKLDPGPETSARAVASTREDGGGVRIADQEVDGLLDLTAEAIISHAELMRFQARLADGRLQAGDAGHLEQVLVNLGQATAEMRRNLLRVRLAPIATLFRRFSRYVRDLARDRGQAIELLIEGGDTAVDRAIISRLHEPLLHLVRNAVAHGLESPADRVAAGKPERARILLGARISEGRARIVVADDGSGLQRERLATRARELGLDGDQMSDSELRRLIFQPGFSTAKEVSTLAGRGVGLAVVANVVQSLGGAIDVRSVAGQGTVFLIDLPVTTSLVKAVIFGVDSEMFAVPTSHVVDSLEVREADMCEINRVPLCRWRGEFLRAMDGGRVLGCPGLAQDSTRPFGIIVEAVTKRCVLLVDWLVGVQEIIVKPLDASLSQSQLLSGLTIMGQGRVVPILDCGELVRRASGPLVSVRAGRERSARDVS
jgi:two-component system, chemotaxis family, sensor kinase CheA